MINRSYINDIEKIRTAFNADGKLPSVTLHDFFSEDFYLKLEKEMNLLNYRKEKNILTHSYAKSKLYSKVLAAINSSELLNYLSSIIGKEIRRVDGEAYKFYWQDYTILNDDVKEELGVDIVIDFTEDWDEDFGGSLFYVDGTHHQIPVRRNTISVIERKHNVQRFLKYVNNHAGRKKRCLLICRIVV